MSVQAWQMHKSTATSRIIQVISLTISYSSGGIPVHSLWCTGHKPCTQSRALVVSQAGQIVSLTLSSVLDRNGGGEGDGEVNAFCLSSWVNTR